MEKSTKQKLIASVVATVLVILGGYDLVVNEDANPLLLGIVVSPAYLMLIWRICDSF